MQCSQFLHATHSNIYNVIKDSLFLFSFHYSAPDPVGDIRITFNESSQMFDTTTQLLTISVRISWNIAGELNGILQGFSLELRDSLGAIVHRNDSISPSIMSVSEVVSLSPFQFYNVTINATTEGGSSSASSSARSPEAGESVEGVPLVYYIIPMGHPCRRL